MTLRILRLGGGVRKSLQMTENERLEFKNHTNDLRGRDTLRKLIVEPNGEPI